MKALIRLLSYSDGNTEWVWELTREELKLLKSVQYKSQDFSTEDCKPKFTVTTDTDEIEKFCAEFDKQKKEDSQ